MDIRSVVTCRDVSFRTFPTDNARQIYWQKKANALKKQGALSDTNY